MTEKNLLQICCFYFMTTNKCTYGNMYNIPQLHHYTSDGVVSFKRYVETTFIVFYNRENHRDYDNNTKTLNHNSSCTIALHT